MREMMNVAFQNAWFGPFALPNPYTTDPDDEEKLHPGVVYNLGPLDGLREASMHAQWFAQIPIINYAQARMAGPGRMTNEKPVFCKPGYMPVPTDVPGQSKCVFFSPPSGMMTGEGPGMVGNMAPPGYPALRTFPVKPFYGFENKGVAYGG